MSAIKGSGNKRTELRLIRLFKLHGITGWRRNWPLEGKPDFAFSSIRVAVFVDGCFWHRCPKHYQAPQQNAEFWEQKIGRNVQRDREVSRLLRAKNWAVIRLWEHDLRSDGKSALRKLRRLLEF